MEKVFLKRHRTVEHTAWEPTLTLLERHAVPGVGFSVMRVLWAENRTGVQSCLHDQLLVSWYKESSDALVLSSIHSLTKQTYKGLGVFRGLSRDSCFQVPTTWLSGEQHLDPADPERPVLSEWLGKWQASLSNLESKSGFDKRMGLSWVSQVGETGTLLAPWVEVAFGYWALTAIPCHLYMLRFCCVYYNSIVVGASKRCKFRGWQGMFSFSII